MGPAASIPTAVQAVELLQLTALNEEASAKGSQAGDHGADSPVDGADALVFGESDQRAVGQ